MITTTKKERLFLSEYHTVWMLYRKNSEVSVSIVPTGYRHVTDTSPTVGRLSVCWPTGSVCLWQNLSANSRSFGELFFTITLKGESQTFRGKPIHCLFLKSQTLELALNVLQASFKNEQFFHERLSWCTYGVISEDSKMLCKLFYLDIVEVTPPEEKELVYSEAEDSKPKPIPVAEFARYFRNKSSNGAIVLREEFKVR